MVKYLKILLFYTFFINITKIYEIIMQFLKSILGMIKKMYLDNIMNEITVVLACMFSISTRFYVKLESNIDG